MDIFVPTHGGGIVLTVQVERDGDGDWRVFMPTAAELDRAPRFDGLAYYATLPWLARSSTMMRAAWGTDVAPWVTSAWPGENTQGLGVQARFVRPGAAEGLLDCALRTELGPLVLAVRGSEDGPAICRRLTRGGA